MENLIEKVNNLFASFDNADMINYLTYESFACEGLEDWTALKSTQYFGQECFCDCGASRFCIIPKEENFVFKASFSGMEHTLWEGDLDEYEEEKEHIKQTCYVKNENINCITYIEPFENCFFQNQHYANYCEIEEAIYKYIEEEYPTLAPLFTKLEKIGNFYGVTVYTQPKVDEVLSETQKPHPYIKNSKEYCKVKKIFENYHCSTLFDLHPAWVIDVMNIYGEDILRTLAEFIYNYVFDLHSSNYGWLQGKPVIFDYAGFED